jgi:hypothetical protein
VMATTNERTVMTIRGMVIDIRSDECLYVTIGDKTYYIDDSTGEAIMEWWPTGTTAPHSDLGTIDLDHDLGIRDLTGPF